MMRVPNILRDARPADRRQPGEAKGRCPLPPRLRGFLCMLSFFLLTAPLPTPAPAEAAFFYESDTATFINDGLYVSLEEPFGELPITEAMVKAGESEPLTARILVYSTVPYTLRVDIQGEGDVDLAGSAMNTGHPAVSDARDAF